jgi:hypothetical protein
MGCHSQRFGFRQLGNVGEPMISPEHLQQLLQRVHSATQKRDASLNSLNDMSAGTLSSNDAAERAAEFVTDAFHVHVVAVAEQAAAMATEVQAAGRGAETSHRKVRAMDDRLSNVRDALKVVQAVVQQRASVSKVSVAVENGEYETAVNCIVQYDSVSNILSGFPDVAKSGRATAHNGSDDDSAASGSGGQISSLSFGDDAPDSLSSADTIKHARNQLRVALNNEVDAACKAKLEPSVCRFATMLAQLGYVDEGCGKFTNFVVDGVKADLQSFVDLTLRDVAAGKTTHLIACVSVLDRIAAAVEKHKPFMDKTFPGRSHNFVLALHSEATHYGVDVLKDFLSSRRGVVGKVQAQKRFEGSAVTSVDPRSLDQTLEDIAHLLTCCHQYLTYVSHCITAHLDPAHEKAELNRLRSKIQDSALLKEVSGLMNVYVPVQADYLQAAFRVVAAQCDEGIAQHLKPLRPALETSAAPGNFTEAIMGTIWGSGNAGAASAQSAGSSGKLTQDLAPGTKRFKMILAELDVTLVDDLFHVLLVAIRRAVGTRDVTIASATVNAINQVLTDQLVPELRRRLATNATLADNSLSPVASIVEARLKALWLQAAYNAAEYTGKLSVDFDQVAAANIICADLVRHTEQKHDFSASAARLR